jgi:DNA-binding Xre family transcriptional regulator
VKEEAFSARYGSPFSCVALADVDDLVGTSEPLRHLDIQKGWKQMRRTITKGACMTESRRYERRQQATTIKRQAGDTNTRGAYLYGLRACRRAAALTQRELAEMSGTYQSTIHDLENRRRGAYPKTIRGLCQALDVGPSELLCQDP